VLLALRSGLTPEWAAKISGVPEETITRIAIEFAIAKNKGALSWTGVAQVPNGIYGTAVLVEFSVRSALWSFCFNTCRKYYFPSFEHPFVSFSNFPNFIIQNPARYLPDLRLFNISTIFVIIKFQLQNIASGTQWLMKMDKLSL
jgi:hypothetical protein